MDLFWKNVHNIVKHPRLQLLCMYIQKLKNILSNEILYLEKRTWICFVKYTSHRILLGLRSDTPIPHKEIILFNILHNN